MKKNDLIDLIDKLDKRVFKMKANTAVVQAHADILRNQLEDFLKSGQK